ncbi:hypothetical protein Tco_1543866 [Tanacetum coccineum]
MKRVGKGFSGRKTPLFTTMVVQAQEEMGEGSEMPTDPHHTPIITQPSSTQPQRKQKSRRSKRRDTKVPQPSDPTNVADEAINEEPKKKGGPRTHKLKRLYKVGRSTRIVSSDEASLGDQEDGRHDDDIMFNVSDLAGEEVFVVEQRVPDNKKDNAAQVNTADVCTANTILVSVATITEDEITLAQALAELKSVKPTTATSTRPKAKGLVKVQDKGKGILVEEPVKSIKKKDQLRLDEELAFKLQAEEEEEEERLVREKVEASVALTKEWNGIQAKIKTDCELAQRLQAEEEEELTVNEKATLFQQLLGCVWFAECFCWNWNVFEELES